MTRAASRPPIVCRRTPPLFRLTALGLALAHAHPAAAQGVAQERELAPVIVSGSRSPLDPNLPTTTYSQTAEELRDYNFVRPEDALKYAPNVTIRSRYIGDRNALIGGRSHSNLQAQRGLVYVDGYLISNFLGRFNAPRWNIVAPEEIERVDLLYGPYSAIYPGNSIGTTVAITTRDPKGFEATGRALAYTQQFDEYGVDGGFGGNQLGAFLANRVGDFRFALTANRLDGESHPMQYQTFNLSQGSAAPGGTPVTGAFEDLDPNGRPRVVTGANSAALEDSLQQMFKFRTAYDLRPWLGADAFYARWRNDYDRRNQTFLRDAAGDPVYAGQVRINGLRYTIPATALAPQRGDEEHDQFGARLRTRFKTGWNASVQVSRYRIVEDLLRTADSPDPVAFTGGPGSLADGEDTGWETLELQATHTPAARTGHSLSFGVHANRYELHNRTLRGSNWLVDATATTLDQFYNGRTRNEAVYAQDAWRFSPDWVATAGLRWDRWRAYGGDQFIRGTNANQTLFYPERRESDASPKFSLAYYGLADWLVRLSLAKGVRYPTVAELFQGARTGNNITVNDPDLAPEVSYAKDLTAERELGDGVLRVSLFEDDVRDTILQQTNLLVTPNVTNVQNIPRVRTRGVELVYNGEDVGVDGLDIDANLAYARSRTLENPAFPASEGKEWVRIPRLRANLVATYGFHPDWSGTLAARHSGRQFNNLDNSDVNPDTFGGSSRYTVLDAKLAWQASKVWNASLGVDNLTDERYYVFHPYPGRTFFAELRGQF